MELKEFIKDSITQIVEGVVEAKGAIKDSGASIPSRYTVYGETGAAFSVAPTRDSASVEFVSFDVALTATTDSEVTAGIGVFLPALGMGTKGKTRREVEHLSRLQFRVPITMPKK